MRIRILALATTLGSALALSACGTAPVDRAFTGSLLGAGAGLAIGSVTGAGGTGAVIGAVAGGAAGLLTSPCQVDLGSPPWRDAREREEWEHRCGRPYPYYNSYPDHPPHPY